MYAFELMCICTFCTFLILKAFIYCNDMIQQGDNVCFGERLGAFGKIPHKVTGIEQMDDGLYIKTDYSANYVPANMFEKCS